jgi:hypothetical protein
MFTPSTPAMKLSWTDLIDDLLKDGNWKHLIGVQEASVTKVAHLAVQIALSTDPHSHRFGRKAPPVHQMVVDQVCRIPPSDARRNSEQLRVLPHHIVDQSTLPSFRHFSVSPLIVKHASEHGQPAIGKSTQ